MGYVLRPTCTISEPSRVTLGGLPNFVQFSGKKTTGSHPIILRLTPPLAGGLSDQARTFLVTNSEGAMFSFIGTYEKNEATGSGFLIMPDDAPATAQNLRAALLGNAWIAANFLISVPFAAWQEGTPPSAGIHVRLESRAAGSYFDIDVQCDSAVWVCEFECKHSVNNDTLLAVNGGTPTAIVELDIYRGTGLALSQEDSDPNKLGEYITTVQKTYSGDPLWFDINAIANAPRAHAFPGRGAGVFPADTVQNYRFTARLAGANNALFYLSDVLYIVRGNGPLGIDAPSANTPGGNLAAFVIGPGPGKLLTDAPRLRWTEGQPLLVNAILGQAPYNSEPPINVVVEVFSVNGDYIGEFAASPALDRRHTLVTVSIDVHTLASQWIEQGAALLKIAIKQNGAFLTNFAEFEIASAQRYTLRPFIFLNRLGGWEAFNFDAPQKEEIKPSIETYTRTVRPGFVRGDSVEAVYGARLNTTYTVEAAPVSDGVAKWLKQLAASPAVFDGEGNAVIIDDFALLVDPERKNMQRPLMKYHLSESAYNG